MLIVSALATCVPTTNTPTAPKVLINAFVATDLLMLRSYIVYLALNGFSS